jgi:hypothetical protein
MNGSACLSVASYRWTVARDVEGGLTLRGEALAVMVNAAAVGAAVRPGLGGWPGPGLLVAVQSPTALFLARPGRLGWRPVLHATLAVVGDHKTRARLQGEFGLPAEVGRLSWVGDGHQRRVTWTERRLVITARGSRLAAPIVVRLRLAQHRADGLVLSPVRGVGLARSAVAVVELGVGGDRLAGLAGRHRGLLLSGIDLVVRPARPPSRVSSGVRSAALGAEPAGLG